MTHPVYQIIAKTFLDLDVGLITHVPGSDGSAIFNEWLKISGKSCPMSFHEEVACAVAHGAALTGMRSAAIIKSHGMAKAGNMLVDALSAGTNAGFVILVLHDESGLSSDNAFDAIALINGLELLYHIGMPKTIREDVLLCFRRSEETRLPYVLYLNDAHLEKKVANVAGNGKKQTGHAGRAIGKIPRYRRDIVRHLVGPMFSTYQRLLLENALEGLDPETIPRPRIPVIPDDLPEEWQPAVRQYATLFEAFRHVRGDVVAGDTGVSSLYAFPPFDCVDITTYMGGSIPLALGALEAGHKKVWALTGDFSFVSAGHIGLLEAVNRKLPLKTVIFFNQKAATTGGQEMQPGILERILRSYEESVSWIHDPTDMCEAESALFRAFREDGMQIIVADYRGLSEPSS